MKNRYEIREDEVAIYINSPDGQLEALISLGQMSKMDTYNGMWFAHWNPTAHQYYVWGNLDYIGEDGEKRRRTIQLHTFIMQPPKGKIVDHIDRNPLRNTNENLRITTKSGNNQNLGHERANNKTGYRGVVKRKTGYRAQVRLNGKMHTLGTYPTAEEANIIASAFRRQHMKCSAIDEGVNVDDGLIEHIKSRQVRAKKSKYMGLNWYVPGGVWQVYANIDGKRTYIMRCKNETTASIARDITLFKHYGANLPKDMRFNHPDIFNASTVTWDAIAADPQLYHRIG